MHSPQQNIILKSDALEIGYATKKQKTIVANNIDINLEKGNLVCLLGKNGIGKSTLLRTISKVQPKISGDLWLEHQKIEEISSKMLSQKMSLVLTERIPESNLTVYELIALGRQPYTNWIGTLNSADKTYIEKALTQINIVDLAHRKCDQLSDGQLQKVMIARALAQNTELIILDEPTAHLDIHHKIEVFQLLKNLVQNLGKTVIISTHEVQLALQLADKLWLMNENNFVNGATDELISNKHLDSLFSNELIQFDAKSKQFILKKS